MMAAIFSVMYIRRKFGRKGKQQKPNHLEINMADDLGVFCAFSTQKCFKIYIMGENISKCFLYFVSYVYYLSFKHT